MLLKLRGRRSGWILVAILMLAACDSAPTPSPGLQATATAVGGSGAVSSAGVGVPGPTPAVVVSEEMSPPMGATMSVPNGLVVQELLTPVPEGESTPASTLQSGSTSALKIDAAEQAGRLDHNTALVYKLLAAHEPEKLPAELRGEADATSGEGDMSVLAELVSRFGSLPGDLKAKADSYLSRPEDGASFWYARIAEVRGSSPDFKSVDAGEHVRMWYDSKEGSDAAELASKLASEVVDTEMWDTEKEIMLGNEPCSDAGIKKNGGDGRLDMYLVPDGAVFPRPSLSSPVPFHAAGLTIPQAVGKGGCPYIAYIMLDEGADYDYLRSAMSHELFHAYQFSFKQPDSASYWWWMETSATWVEDQIYPTLNQEWFMLSASNWTKYNGPNGPLDNFEEGGYAQYGAYIWPFFLTNGPGAAPPTLIGDIYTQVESRSPLKVMAASDGWAEQFKQFALWNWNSWPAQFYSDHGKPISVLSQKAAPLQVTPGSGASTTEVKLPHTSVRYYSVKLNAIMEGVGQFNFDVSSLTRQAGGGVQAIIVTGKGDEAAGHIEDWSSLGKRNLCFRETAQPSRIVLVVSNSGIGSGLLQGQISMQAKSGWCPGLTPPAQKATATPGT